MNPTQVISAPQGQVRRGTGWAIIGLWLAADLLLGGASAAAPPPASSPRKWASSLPSMAPKRHVLTTLAYEDLGRHIGERMLITTHYGDLRDVIIETYSAQELLVRVPVIGGYATQHIQRSQIRSIRDPQ